MVVMAVTSFSFPFSSSSYSPSYPASLSLRRMV